MKEPQFLDLLAPGAAAVGDLQASLAAEAATGLCAHPASVAPKFFYDELGSRLFDAITALDEYYPTRTEAAILATHGPDIAQRVHRCLGPTPTLVDLGAGSCAKAASLFPLLRPARYIALDFSLPFLREAMVALQRQHPALPMLGVGLDFSARLALPPNVLQEPALLFYPGSSIGNFDPAQALRLLREAFATAAGGALLIGVDLDKPDAVLEAAYDDALGVTAAFNLNLLRHLNRVLGSDFDVRGWRHVALYNRAAGRIEMHLRALTTQTVRWPGGERRFAQGERIHTENSYKWGRASFEALLRDAGFGRVQGWTDERGWFAVMLAEAG